MGPTLRELHPSTRYNSGISGPGSPFETCPQDWFALTVKPQHEATVRLGLEAKQLKSYLPTYTSVRRWSDRKKRIELPLFPGYVFSQFENTDRTHVLRTPGVRSIVSFGTQLIPVPSAELLKIARMLSSPYPLEPWPYLQTGEPVKIESGPLAGITGIFERREGGSRFVVSIEMLQRSIAVHLEADDLSPVNHHSLFISQ